MQPAVATGDYTWNHRDNFRIISHWFYFTRNHNISSAKDTQTKTTKSFCHHHHHHHHHFIITGVISSNVIQSTTRFDETVVARLPKPSRGCSVAEQQPLQTSEAFQASPRPASALLRPQPCARWVHPPEQTPPQAGKTD